MMGMLLGRTNMFIPSEVTLRFWKRTLIGSVLLFLLLFVFKGFIPKFGWSGAAVGSLSLIVSSLSNFGFTMVWVSLFVLVYQKNYAQRILSKLSPIGKMTLTNYMVQSLIGSIIYYGYGFGIYKYTGATFCLLIGICLFWLQLQLCKWWLKTHNQGPLEFWWHKATWIDLNANF